MRIHLHTRSEAVRRTLSTLLDAAGHEAVELDEAECVLVDAIHPAAKPSKSDLPTLTLGGDSEGALPVPLRVATVLQSLQRLTLPPIALSGGWQFDPLARSLSHASHPAVALTEKESALLHALATAGSNGALREVLLSDIWGMSADADTHTLETHVYRLRAKLGALTPVPAELANEGGTYRLAVA